MCICGCSLVVESHASDLVARVRFSVPAPTENKEVQRFAISLYFMLWRNFSVIGGKKLKQVV